MPETEEEVKYIPDGKMDEQTCSLWLLHTSVQQSKRIKSQQICYHQWILKGCNAKEIQPHTTCVSSLMPSPNSGKGRVSPLGEFGVNWNGVRMTVRVSEMDLYLDVVCTVYAIFKCYQTWYFTMYRLHLNKIKWKGELQRRTMQQRGHKEVCAWLDFMQKKLQRIPLLGESNPEGWGREREGTGVENILGGARPQRRGVHVVTGGLSWVPKALIS